MLYCKTEPAYPPRAGPCGPPRYPPRRGGPLNSPVRGPSGRFPQLVCCGGTTPHTPRCGLRPQTSPGFTGLWAQTAGGWPSVANAGVHGASARLWRARERSRCVAFGRWSGGFAGLRSVSGPGSPGDPILSPMRSSAARYWGAEWWPRLEMRELRRRFLVFDGVYWPKWAMVARVSELEANFLFGSSWRGP